MRLSHLSHLKFHLYLYLPVRHRCATRTSNRFIATVGSKSAVVVVVLVCEHASLVAEHLLHSAINTLLSSDEAAWQRDEVVCTAFLSIPRLHSRVHEFEPIVVLDIDLQLGLC